MRTNYVEWLSAFSLPLLFCLFQNKRISLLDLFFFLVLFWFCVYISLFTLYSLIPYLFHLRVSSCVAVASVASEGGDGYIFFSFLFLYVCVCVSVVCFVFLIFRFVFHYPFFLFVFCSCLISDAISDTIKLSLC